MTHHDNIISIFLKIEKKCSLLHTSLNCTYFWAQLKGSICSLSLLSASFFNRQAAICAILGIVFNAKLVTLKGWHGIILLSIIFFFVFYPRSVCVWCFFSINVDSNGSQHFSKLYTTTTVFFLAKKVVRFIVYNVVLFWFFLATYYKIHF